MVERVGLSDDVGGRNTSGRTATTRRARTDHVRGRETPANEFRTRALELGSIETDLGETIGDESRAFTFQQPTADAVLITLTVLFRYANVVDAVEVTGRIGSFERAYVLEFAKKQLERPRADAQKR